MDDKRPRIVPAPRGRAATSNVANRYIGWQREACDDVAPSLSVSTEVQPDHSRSVIRYNRSPDLPFDRSINPYRGCEHGCIYCYARPGHAWLDLSPGLDFETRLFYKADAVRLLEQELGAAKYRCQPLAIGMYTDVYQPLERRLQLTRSLLQRLLAWRHPFVLVTKSGLIRRDLDVLAEAAAANLVHVMFSLTTLDKGLARTMEPRAASPTLRLHCIQQLRDAGVPVGVMLAPVIPVLTDREIEALLAAAHKAGAQEAAYVLLRLPLELKTLFGDWLQQHYPLQAEHVWRRLRDCHGDRVYDSRFGHRRRGQGPYADILRQRFLVARRRLGFSALPELDTTAFRAPATGLQLSLF